MHVALINYVTGNPFMAGPIILQGIFRIGITC